MAPHLMFLHDFIGSNDSNEINELHADELNNALTEFKNHVEKVLDSLLNIPKTFVILPTIFPRLGIYFDLTNNVLEDIVR